MKYQLTEALDWGTWVTPKGSRGRAFHRWLLFPHSFTADLVYSLIDEWKLGQKDRLLDPFVGAGTTLLAAKEKQVPGQGYDISPLAVLATRVKTAGFRRETLEATWAALDCAIQTVRTKRACKRYPELVEKALPDGRLSALDGIAQCINELEVEEQARDFFKLALIAVVRRFSQAVANGGWLRWTSDGAEAKNVLNVYRERVQMMLADTRETEFGDMNDAWSANIADARELPDQEGQYSAVISSPPYPNRHDYTRVFGVELMFGFLDWEANRELRHQSFHSHPEARPKRPKTENYIEPRALDESVRHVKDCRVREMLRGYFLDMYLCLREVKRVCRTGAMVAFVVGNARYDGKAVLVDEYTAELGESVGLECSEIRAVRWRGNSAQQMGRYGRLASRESVVLMQKP